MPTHDEPLVHTTAGPVRGLDDGGVATFLGVPYAAPPVGARRFAAPVPPEPWDGVRDARAFGPTAPQPVAGILPQTIIEGDDYLHLNVHTPDPGAAGLPVLVWIHGGGMVVGSNADGVTQGANLARRGIVVVAINYRLGVEGFLALRDAPRNRGVLDWLLALAWVQDNVAAFGGDPGNVTVGGHSAGSAAAMVVAANPRASGLFGRVVAMSGLPWNLCELATAQRRAEELAGHLGVEPTGAGIDPVPRDHLLATQQELAPLAGIRGLGDPLAMFHEQAATMDGAWLGPVIDGDLLPEHPMGALARGDGGPVLAGSTAQEMDALLAIVGGSLDHHRAARALVELGLHPDAAGRWCRAHADRSGGAALGAALTALNFRLPLLRLAESRPAGAPTFVYETCWEPPTPLGAVHGYDLAFAFDNPDAEGVELASGGPPPRSLADDLAGALVRFVATGDPGWAAYGPADRSVMAFGLPSAVRSDPDRLARQAFAGIGFTPVPA